MPLTTILLALSTVLVGAGAHTWTGWSGWSECSRTCDGGASYQLRRCTGSQRCEGDNIRYKTCNRTPCPAGSVDFRAQQCSAYNDVQYEARMYEWVPMPEPRDPCSLRCRAAQHAFSVMLAPKVLDGTRCDTTTIDMCINGTCRKVGCDGMLGSTLTEDRCGVCGGDGSRCGSRRGSHSRPIPLSQFRWVETEAGPCSVTCGVGVAKTSVVCKDRRNLRVVYNTYCSHLRKPRTTPRQCSVSACQPVWITGEWQGCSRSCGSGTSQRHVSCVKEHENGSFRNTFAHLCTDSRPSTERTCNHHPCPKWYAGSWSPCSKTCAKGVQHREVICRRTQHHSCRLSHRPHTRRPCNNYVTCMGQKAETHTNGSAAAQIGRSPQLAVNPARVTTVAPSVKDNGKHSSLSLDSDESVNNFLNQLLLDNMSGSNHTLELTSTAPVVPSGGETLQHSSLAPPSVNFQRTTPAPPLLRRIKVKILEEKPDDVIASHFVQPETRQETYFLHASGRKTSFLEPYLEGRLGQVEEKVAAQATHLAVGKPGGDGSGERTGDEVLMPDGNLENMQTGDASHKALNAGVSTVPRFTSSAWGICSVTCGYGIRTRAVMCKVYLKFSQTVQDLPDGGCPGDKPQEVEQCHLVNCTHTSEAPDEGKTYRWRHDSYTHCNVTCLGGFETPTYKCIEQSAAQEVDTLMCEGTAKPLIESVECNKVPCPPRWRVEQFRPCSALCGGGHRRRRVECVRHLETGGLQAAVLPDAHCPAPVPRRSILCNLVDCPPSWVVTGDWSQCSMTCGEGISTRPVLCQQVVHPGRTQNTSHPSECPAARPESRRPCYNNACPQAHTDTQHVTIASDQTKYVMLAESRRVQLVVGGEAVLLPGVNAVVRCPAKHYNRKLVYWRKKDALLPRRGRIKVSRHGALHMKRTLASDAGTYTCVVDASSSNITVSFHTPQQAERLLQGRSTYLSYNYRDLLTQRRTDENRVIAHDEVGDKEAELQAEPGVRFHELLSRLSRNVSGLPYVYYSGAWSACSKTCGFRGVQYRNVTCEVITETYIRGVDDDMCRRQGLAEPLASQDCGMHACPHWEIGPWTRCSGRKCNRAGVGMSTRDLYCVLENGTTTNHGQCGNSTKPQGVRQCRHDACTAQWRPSDWSKCSRSCGGLGMKRRSLRCVWLNNGGPAGRHCRGLPRPPTDKACTAPDCKHVPCIDKSNTCRMIPRLKLCHVWHTECCRSCHPRTRV